MRIYPNQSSDNILPIVTQTIIRSYFFVDWATVYSNLGDKQQFLTQLKGIDVVDPEKFEYGKFYKLKVVVNDCDVDVYYDNNYAFLTKLDENHGNMVGLFSSSPNVYFKNFKLTVNN